MMPIMASLRVLIRCWLRSSFIVTVGGQPFDPWWIDPQSRGRRCQDTVTTLRGRLTTTSSYLPAAGAASWSRAGSVAISWSTAGLVGFTCVAQRSPFMDPNVRDLCTGRSLSAACW